MSLAIETRLYEPVSGPCAHLLCVSSSEANPHKGEARSCVSTLHLCVYSLNL